MLKLNSELGVRRRVRHFEESWPMAAVAAKDLFIQRLQPNHGNRSFSVYLYFLVVVATNYSGHH